MLPNLTSIVGCPSLNNKMLSPHTTIMGCPLLQTLDHYATPKHILPIHTPLLDPPLSPNQPISLMPPPSIPVPSSPFPSSLFLFPIFFPLFFIPIRLQTPLNTKNSPSRRSLTDPTGPIHVSSCSLLQRNSQRGNGEISFVFVF